MLSVAYANFIIFTLNSRKSLSSPEIVEFLKVISKSMAIITDIVIHDIIQCQMMISVILN